MTITSDGWFDWMVRKPGPADKIYSAPCTSELYIPHSAIGNNVEGWYSRLYSTAREADGRYTAYAAASVTGWFFKEQGRAPEQYYPLTASCWASGTRDWNTRGNAFENAGGYDPIDEPLTDWQVECNVRAMREIAAWKGRDTSYWRRPAFDGDLTATLYEHRESVWVGGAATGCPNGRIPWDRFKAELEDEMDADEREWLMQTTHRVAWLMGEAAGQTESGVESLVKKAGLATKAQVAALVGGGGLTAAAVVALLAEKLAG